MKLKSLAVMAIAIASLASCKETKRERVEIPHLTAEEIAAGRFTPEVMWKMGRISESTISPDGASVVFSVTYYDVAENAGATALYSVSTEGGEPTLIEENASTPQWDGDKLYFLRDGQLWLGGKQLTDIEGGIEGYGVVGESLWFAKKVHVKNTQSADVYSDMPSSKALVYDDLMARHWNYWDRGDYMHLFVGKIGDKEFTDIMKDEPWDSPIAPYWDMAEISWNNAGTILAYSCKKSVGTEYATTTDSDIYLYDTTTGTTRNICKGNAIYPMVGYDKYPVWSPDDRRIAFASQERSGNESDKSRLFVYDLETEEVTYLTADFDYNAENICWVDNSQIWFVAPIEATLQLCSVMLDGGVNVLTSGDHDIVSFSVSLDDNRCVAELTTMSSATELYTISGDGTLAQLTNINREIYDNIRMGEIQKRWITTTDGKQMLTWVILPPDFDATKKYPTLLYCEGGPQSVISQSWSYRWNFQLMAAQGYVIVAPNRRGLPSFGQEWLDQISGDYPGQNMKDYLSAIDDVSREAWVDKAHLGCVGASYGGYSAFYLAGNSGKRFKAFIAHCGIFNAESMYGETEELFFVNNDYGGAYWDMKNATAQRTYRLSPHKSVGDWYAPILIFTGINDFRIPYTQSLQAFTAARLRGIDSRLVVFENEAHQVFQPQNSMVWNREFFGWLDKYLK